MAVLKHSTIARNAAADAVVDLLDLGTGDGRIEIRSGSMPTNPQAAVTGVLLATIALQPTAAGTASNGVVTITDPAAVTASNTGTATWARFFNFDNGVIFDCDVTATGGGGALTLDTVAISSGVTVNMGAITYTVPE
jgi:hypothetical protein